MRIYKITSKGKIVRGSEETPHNWNNNGIVLEIANNSHILPKDYEVMSVKH